MKLLLLFLSVQNRSSHLEKHNTTSSDFMFKDFESINCEVLISGERRGWKGKKEKEKKVLKTQQKNTTTKAQTKSFKSNFVLPKGWPKTYSSQKPTNQRGNAHERSCLFSFSLDISHGQTSTKQKLAPPPPPPPPPDKHTPTTGMKASSKSLLLTTIQHKAI